MEGELRKTDSRANRSITWATLAFRRLGGTLKLLSLSSVSSLGGLSSVISTARETRSRASRLTL